MKAVILVGGEGTRLRPLTLDTPKPLVPVGNRPFLEHVLASLSRHGVQEAILTTGYRAEAFDTYPPERTYGVQLTVVREEDPLGTAGAVKNIEHMLTSTFLVLNGDILTNLDLTALVNHHRRKESVATLTLTSVRDPSAYGLVPIDDDGKIQRFIEKPRADEVVTDLINAGTYVLEPEVLQRVPAGENHSVERGLFPRLLAEGAPLYGFQAPAYWLDLGTPEKYLRANRDVLEGRVGEEPPGTRASSGAWVAKTCEVDPWVQIRGPVAIAGGTTIAEGAVIHPLTCIGRDCRIAGGAVIEESVIQEGVEVERGAVIERSIVCTGAKVGAGCRIEDAVVGAGVRLGADNELRAGIRLWPNLEIPPGKVRF